MEMSLLLTHKIPLFFTDVSVLAGWQLWGYHVSLIKKQALYTEQTVLGLVRCDDQQPNLDKAWVGG